MRRRILLFLVAATVAVAFMPTSAFAASGKVKMTAYKQVIKQGNTIYCAGEGSSIYKVKVKNGKVKSKKKLVKGWVMGDYSYICSMKKKGKYLYYVVGSEGTYWEFWRVNVKNKKKKKLAVNATDFVIKGKKIYAEFYNPECDEWDNDGDYIPLYKVMNLNGTGKTITSVKPVVNYKKGNTKKYKVKYRQKGKYVKTYLKTPKRTYYLGKTKLDWY